MKDNGGVKSTEQAFTSPVSFSQACLFAAFKINLPVSLALWGGAGSHWHSGGDGDSAIASEDGGGDYTEEFATYRIDTGVPGHDNQPVFLRKHLASLRVLAL
ncbi:hypothetical protein EMCRGX_G018657 [Ephydatia muelleri]